MKILILQVYLSYLEIYNEKIRDLLKPVPGVHLELREDTEQVHVSGLSEVRATSTNEVRGEFMPPICILYQVQCFHYTIRD